MNGTRETEGSETAVGLDFSDNEEEVRDDHGGDYSARLEELMSDTEEGTDGHGHDHDIGDEVEGFLYSGTDADPAGGYREQLRDVLGPEHEDDELDERKVRRQSLIDEVQEKEKLAASMEDEAMAMSLDHASPTPSTSCASRSPPASPPKMINFNGTSSSSRISRPFVHPTISRLRSSIPQPWPMPSSGSAGTAYSHVPEGASATPSHLSALSPTPSVVDVSFGQADVTEGQSHQVREIFRWTNLRVIGDHIYSRQSQKASSLLGTVNLGSPTVLAANGLICVGTDAGRVIVFDFKQNLKCVCGVDTPDRAVGSVTAVALSFDHTFVACGHSSGHVQLFDLNSPKTPVRFVAPTSLAAVASGRQEGHLVGSRIVSVGFIAGRHTAIVSADDRGLAFYHSLGKVFFMEASDTLRLLGKYPDEDLVSTTLAPQSGAHHFRRRKSRKASTILAMGPLPLGTTSNSTDQYNLIALLTPMKLVIVGLKPSPKTWYRQHRDSDDDVGSKSKFKGTLAWFPSIASDPTVGDELTNGKATANGTSHRSSTAPMLIYSWGDMLYLMRISETKVPHQIRNSRTGTVSTVEVGRVVFEEVGQFSAGGDVLALHWLNVNQVVVLTTQALEVYDVRSTKVIEQAPYDAWSLVSPILSHTTNGSVSYSDAATEVAHSMRVYKGKIFMLGHHELRVGTLLTWADRLLSFVEKGDFLSAIELTRAYYVGEAPGNRNGLPESPEKLKAVVGNKMRELMVASAHYAFSEDRMTDGTHVTPNGRGVDRTALFEGLVKTCARASIALDDYDFLFEDLFQYYDDNGIARIFLTQLESFVLDGTIRHIPPRITQRLVAIHEEDNHPALVERIIWHIDPDCLDVNQAITLCQRYHLYDALIYVFTRAMKDYVSPMVELLGLIRKVQQYRRTREEGLYAATVGDDEAIEPMILNAYKIYPYLANVLTGVAYPSQEPLAEDEASQAKNDVYTFLFFGRSTVWPLGEGGKLVLTADEDNGVEPTYPYARLLLRFDPEAFLHTLDLAFEDAYLNDETRGISRLVIVKIFLEILSSPELSHTEATFVNIFIARNVPKYPQFVHIPLSSLHSILIGLAEDSDQSTREDRQLAAEYLLSAYTPHESDRITKLFEEAGFYRILRSWYKQERQWSPLLMTYLNDPDLQRSDIFLSINEVLDSAKHSHKGTLPTELLATVVDSLPFLLNSSVVNTAALLDKHVPSLHERALEAIDDADEERFAYLRYLLGPPIEGEEDVMIPYRTGGPSPHVPPSLRRTYLTLHCRFDPQGLIRALRYLPSDFVDASNVVQISEEHEAYAAAIWTLDRSGDPLTALSKVEKYEHSLSSRLADALLHAGSDLAPAIAESLSALQAIGKTAVSMCLRYSQSAAIVEVPLEDMWYQLLRSQIDAVQRIARCFTLGSGSLDEQSSSEACSEQQRTLSYLRSFVQETFTSLMSISSTKAVLLPRLFKRLLSAASASHVSKPTLYAEFRTLFTGMLESYRSDSDMLIITKHLVEDDLFATIEELAQERIRGWAPSRGSCRSCGQTLLDNKNITASETDAGRGGPVIISRTGDIYHSRCLPASYHPNTADVH